MTIRVGALFVGGEGRLRNGWWMALFMALLTALLFPTLLLAQRAHREITVAEQALMLLAVTWLCQRLRRRALTQVIGRLDGCWPSQLSLGLLIGAVMMLAPALFLALGGWIDWSVGRVSPAVLWSGVLLMASVAFAEELLFRGFLFQRLIDGLGVWPAQILIGALFVLTHLDNPGMAGATRLWAGANIFLASILFGLAYVRTRSLALPIGIHFMANLAQGTILGLGVSGTAAQGLLTPQFGSAPAWLTGGDFGLEASLPGLVCVILVLAALWRWKPATGSSWGPPA
jgi:membrane protease YdiL (CAAX protease family)